MKQARILLVLITKIFFINTLQAEYTVKLITNHGAVLNGELEKRGSRIATLPDGSPLLSGQSFERADQMIFKAFEHLCTISNTIEEKRNSLRDNPEELAKQCQGYVSIIFLKTKGGATCYIWTTPKKVQFEMREDDGSIRTGEISELLKSPTTRGQYLRMGLFTIKNPTGEPNVLSIFELHSILSPHKNIEFGPFASIIWDINETPRFSLDSLSAIILNKEPRREDVPEFRKELIIPKKDRKKLTDDQVFELVKQRYQEINGFMVQTTAYLFSAIQEDWTSKQPKAQKPRDSILVELIMGRARESNAEIKQALSEVFKNTDGGSIVIYAYKHPEIPRLQLGYQKFDGETRPEMAQQLLERASGRNALGQMIIINVPKNPINSASRVSIEVFKSSIVTDPADEQEAIDKATLQICDHLKSTSANPQGPCRALETLAKQISQVREDLILDAIARRRMEKAKEKQLELDAKNALEAKQRAKKAEEAAAALLAEEDATETAAKNKIIAQQARKQRRQERASGGSSTGTAQTSECLTKSTDGSTQTDEKLQTNQDPSEEWLDKDLLTQKISELRSSLKKIQDTINPDGELSHKATCLTVTLNLIERSKDNLALKIERLSQLEKEVANLEEKSSPQKPIEKAIQPESPAEKEADSKETQPKPFLKNPQTHTYLKLRPELTSHEQTHMCYELSEEAWLYQKRCCIKEGDPFKRLDYKDVTLIGNKLNSIFFTQINTPDGMRYFASYIFPGEFDSINLYPMVNVGVKIEDAEFLAMVEKLIIESTTVPFVQQIK